MFYCAFVPVSQKSKQLSSIFNLIKWEIRTNFIQRNSNSIFFLLRKSGIHPRNCIREVSKTIKEHRPHTRTDTFEWSDQIPYLRHPTPLNTGLTDFNGNCEMGKFPIFYATLLKKKQIQSVFSRTSIDMFTFVAYVASSDVQRIWMKIHKAGV